MPELEIAICVIEQENKYLLQLRNGDPSIGAAGLFGCYGGKVEKNENPKQAIIRELSEETNLSISLDNLSKLGEVKVESDYKNKPIIVKAYVYSTILESTKEVLSKEGILSKVHKDKIEEYYDRMTPATLETFKKLMEG
jgi:8-oxo-dGTP pyrophosphatase MutT (NUDIX family)